MKRGLTLARAFVNNPDQSPVLCTGHPAAHSPRCHHADVHAPCVFSYNPSASRMDYGSDCDFFCIVAINLMRKRLNVCSFNSG